MNIEVGLVSKIDAKEDLLLVIDEGIKEDFFEEHGEVFRAIIDHYSKYQTVPEKDTIKRVFPNFEFEVSSEPIQFYIDKLKERHKKKIYISGLPEVAELLTINVDEAEKKLQKLLIESKSKIRSGVDLDVRLNAESRLSEYQKRKDTIGIDGYSTSWPYLDDITGGLHGGELIIIIAKQKMCKTWLLLWIAQHIWREYNVPVIFITKEMGPKAIRRRLEAIECNLPYGSLRRGTLTDQQEKKYAKYLKETEEKAESGELADFKILGYDLSDRSSGVSSIVPKIERYLLNGGVLFVDGLYLMPDDRGESDWKAMVNISSDLKNLALGYNIPIVATTQHNLEDRSDIPRLEGAAYGKYVAQFADVILGIGRSDIDREMHRGNFYILGQREGDIGKFIINMNFNPIDFSQLNIKTTDTYSEDDEEEVYNV